MNKEAKKNKEAQQVVFPILSRQDLLKIETNAPDFDVRSYRKRKKMLRKCDNQSRLFNFYLTRFSINI